MRNRHLYDFRQLPDAQRHVFQIGMPRTGSRSLTVAMHQIGYTAAHGPNTPMEEETWRESIAEGTFAQSMICAKYEFVGHAAPYYFELDKQWPNAQFIFLYRHDMDAWLRSLQVQLTREGSTNGRRGKLAKGTVDTLALIRIALFGTCAYNKSLYKYKLGRYATDVLSYFASQYGDEETLCDKILPIPLIEIPDRLKWTLLSNFLKVDCDIDVPFPRSQSRCAINDVYRMEYGDRGIVKRTINNVAR